MEEFQVVQANASRSSLTYSKQELNTKTDKKDALQSTPNKYAGTQYSTLGATTFWPQNAGAFWCWKKINLLYTVYRCLNLNRKIHFVVFLFQRVRIALLPVFNKKSYAAKTNIQKNTRWNLKLISRSHCSTASVFMCVLSEKGERSLLLHLYTFGCG